MSLVALDLQGRLVVMAGGGTVGARRARAYADDGADVLVVAPALCDDLAALVAQDLVRHRAERIRPSDLDGAWLAHTATGDPDVDLQVVAWAEQRRLWCINAGSGSEGSARTVATARAGELRIGVSSSGGADPRRAGQVARALADVVHAGGIDLRRRRAGGEGRVVLVGGGPGDPELLTVRGRRAIAEADVVVVDRLGARGVLDDLADGVEVIEVGKRPGHHPVPQDEINRILVDRARAGSVVVRLKGGDPYVFGRGGEEHIACATAGVRVETVPGISSAIAVPAAAGIPVTHRGVARAFTVVTGHEALATSVLEQMRSGDATVVMLMGVAMLERIAAAALALGVDPGLPVAIVEEGTTARQRTVRGPLASIARVAQDVGVASPAVIVIGEVARFGLLGPQVEASAAVGARA
ncbi:MAG: uroporphyrinogen-III C-methyltransferase [Actinomycetota bacterium]